MKLGSLLLVTLTVCGLASASETSLSFDLREIASNMKVTINAENMLRVCLGEVKALELGANFLATCPAEKNNIGKKWKNAKNPCKKANLIKQFIFGRSLCIADVSGTITTGGLNSTALNELYSGSVFDQEEMTKISKKYEQCVQGAGKFMQENWQEIWATWKTCNIKTPERPW